MRTYHDRQKGAAALLVTVIILVLMLVTVGYVSRVSLLELKSNTNIDRSKEATIVAQGALDLGAKKFEKDNSYTGDPVSSGSTYGISATTSSAFVAITATASSADGSAFQSLEQKFGYVPVLGFGEIPPIMANGSFDPSGGLTVVANPNGGGDGVPVSAWIDSSAPNGSFTSCQLGEYEAGECDASAMCNKDKADTDIGLCTDFVLPGPGGVPDVFENLFGVPGESWRIIRDNALLHQIDPSESNCGSLDFGLIKSQIAGFYDASGNLSDDSTLPVIWIDFPQGYNSTPANKTCDLDPGPSYSNILGTADTPAIVVVHGGMSLSSSFEHHGILLSFADTYTSSSELVSVVTNGGATVYGSLLANTDVDLGNGGGTIVYDESVMSKISNNGEGSKLLGRRAGSWTDLK